MSLLASDRDDGLLLRVVERKVEARDVVSLTLRRDDGGALPPWSPGAHLVVTLPGGIARSYSLSGDPARGDRYRLGILEEPGSRGGSVAMHALREGDRLVTSAPRNAFPLHRSGGRVLLLAGGIGVTPLVSMAYGLKTAGADYALHYCARSEERAAFRDELQREFSAALCFHFDDGPPAQRFDAARLLREYRPGDELHVCGPAGFIEHVLASASAAGWPATAQHKEYFTAHVIATGRPFTVRAARSGKTVVVGPDQSIADALAVQGVLVQLSCEQGICGTCVTGVLQGLPDHRDSYLTDEERAANNQITVCCSRSNSDELVLDI
ncbi:MAG: 2Fe-2S iron-sulfur cluster-binding protein [Lautropia sp.]